MQFEPTDITQLACSIWESVLALDLEEVPIGADLEEVPIGADLDALAPEDEILTGCIQISGAWNGAVTLRCPRPLAVHMASVMFGTDASELTGAEVDDALGELTNMAGGNIKGLVGGGAQLSLPTVARGRDYRLSVPGSRQVLQLGFRCEGHGIELTILEQDDSHAAAAPSPALSATASA